MFSRPLILKQLPGYRWIVVEGFDFVARAGFRVEVPEGFETDLASVPRWLWWFIAPAGRHAQACVVHDFMYENAVATKAQADALFYEGLRELHVPAWRARLMYWMVRLFGRGKYVQ